MNYKYVPRHIVNLVANNLGTPFISEHQLSQQRWTVQMIELLGPCHGHNRKGKPLWTNSQIQQAKNKPEFVKLVMDELLRVMRNYTTSLPKSEMFSEYFLLPDCVILNSLNVAVKKLFIKRKFYPLKNLFLMYLVERGFCREVAFERDTGLYQLTFIVDGEMFVWHQPSKYGNNFPGITSLVTSKTDSNNGKTTDLFTVEALFDHVEWFTCSIAYMDLEKQLHNMQ